MMILKQTKKKRIWDNVLFPDNLKRLKRANELQNDIKLYTVELTRKKEKLDSCIKTLKEKLDKITIKLDIPKIPYIEKQIYKDSTFWILGTIEFIVDFEIFRRAYHHAYKFWEIKIKKTSIPDISNIDITSDDDVVIIWDRNEPRPGTSTRVTPQNPEVPVRPEITVPEVPTRPKLPPLRELWFKFKWNPRVFSVVVSGFITVLAAIGIDLIVSSYTGSQRKKEIQNYINECREPRVEIYHDIMVLDFLIDQIKAFIMAIDLMTGISEAQLENMFETLQNKCNEEIKKIDDYVKAEEILKQMDKERGSW
ncbi:2783_t:CDS:2, partial [Dentiscutata heterogama]